MTKKIHEDVPADEAAWAVCGVEDKLIGVMFPHTQLRKAWWGQFVHSVPVRDVAKVVEFRLFTHKGTVVRAFVPPFTQSLRATKLDYVIKVGFVVAPPLIVRELEVALRGRI